MLDGAADKSYGVHVAKMASLPVGVIYNAQKKLDEFRQLALKQNAMFNDDNVSIEKTVAQSISNLDIDDITPKQALDILQNLQTQLVEA